MMTRRPTWWRIGTRWAQVPLSPLSPLVPVAAPLRAPGRADRQGDAAGATPGWVPCAAAHCSPLRRRRRCRRRRAAMQDNALEAYHRQVQRAHEAERRREEAERRRWEVRRRLASRLAATRHPARAANTRGCGALPWAPCHTCPCGQPAYPPLVSARDTSTQHLPPFPWPSPSPPVAPNSLATAEMVHRSGP